MGPQSGTGTSGLLERARSGDGEAFAELAEPYRRELQVHCYRVTGSVQDAEDLVQETLLAAWRALAGFEERASLRTWLYRIATNRCLNALRATGRRPKTVPVSFEIEPPEPTGVAEVLWLGPYPDVLLDGTGARPPGPEASYDAREAISLAFITALQLLPARQRAALVLRDVLGFRASEVADMLGTTDESVTSALRRARSTLAQRLPPSGPPPPAPGSAEEQRLVEDFTNAFQAHDVEAVVSLLTEDIKMAMPPAPMEYVGLEAVGNFLRLIVFRPGRRSRLVPTRANGQPAVGFYLKDPTAGVLRAFGVIVLTLRGDRVSAITRFDNSTLGAFGLPRTLPDDQP